MYDTVLRLLTDAGTTPEFATKSAKPQPCSPLVAGGLGTAVVPHPVTTHPFHGVTYIPLHPTAAIPLALAELLKRQMYGRADFDLHR
ncbi:hypothetical protein [Actinokineospora sp. UTMC 2448]|uniref:hypothetical protein n=1 Tax=Actinokineospora sp. UTMC 2448 TaxID=2268449 RepID=UPI0021648C12|nr:hypothetical protein [Actinokineospora sp. UTMC 2448]UVS78438.1 hypothetical protein Actkin_02171 [Actinokineospora sp. UTMC 2448]